MFMYCSLFCLYIFVSLCLFGLRKHLPGGYAAGFQELSLERWAIMGHHGLSWANPDCWLQYLVSWIHCETPCVMTELLWYDLTNLFVRIRTAVRCATRPDNDTMEPEETTRTFLSSSPKARGEGRRFPPEALENHNNNNNNNNNTEIVVFDDDCNLPYKVLSSVINIKPWRMRMLGRSK